MKYPSGFPFTVFPTEFTVQFWRVDPWILKPQSSSVLSIMVVFQESKRLTPYRFPLISTSLIVQFPLNCRLMPTEALLSDPELTLVLKHLIRKTWPYRLPSISVSLVPMKYPKSLPFTRLFEKSWIQYWTLPPNPNPQFTRELSSKVQFAVWVM